MPRYRGSAKSQSRLANESNSKVGCSPEFIQELDRLEEQSNDCYQRLELLRYPENLASWAALTRFIQIIESTIGEHGQYSPQMSADMINLGRSGALLLGWIQRVGQSRDLRQGLPPIPRRAQPPPASLQNRVVPRGDAATKILVQVQAKAPRLSATPRREFQAIHLAG